MQTVRDGHTQLHTECTKQLLVNNLHDGLFKQAGLHSKFTKPDNTKQCDDLIDNTQVQKHTCFSHT